MNELYGIHTYREERKAASYSYFSSFYNILLQSPRKGTTDRPTATTTTTTIERAEEGEKRETAFHEANKQVGKLLLLLL